VDGVTASQRDGQMEANDVLVVGVGSEPNERVCSLARQFCRYPPEAGTPYQGAK